MNKLQGANGHGKLQGADSHDEVLGADARDRPQPAQDLNLNAVSLPAENEELVSEDEVRSKQMEHLQYFSLLSPCKKVTKIQAQLVYQNEPKVNQYWSEQYISLQQNGQASEQIFSLIMKQDNPQIIAYASQMLSGDDWRQESRQAMEDADRVSAQGPGKRSGPR